MRSFSQQAALGTLTSLRDRLFLFVYRGRHGSSFVPGVMSHMTMDSTQPPLHVSANARKTRSFQATALDPRSKYGRRFNRSRNPAWPSSQLASEMFRMI